MRIYLEAIEQVDPQSTDEPEFIRLDVTALTPEQLLVAEQMLSEVVSGANFTKQLHYCYHDQGESCEVMPV